MKRKALTAILLTPFLLGACKERLELNPPPPPADYLECAELPSVPAIAPLTPIRATDGTVVYLKDQTDARDKEIAEWIVDVRGAWFSCSNQLGKVRDYYAEQ